MPAELEPLLAPVPATASRAVSARPAVAWLIDNAEAYAALLDACRSARESIWITQLAFDADCVAYAPGGEAGSAPERVADVLLAAARERGVQVRILLNASRLLDTATALRAFVAARGADATCVRIRGVDRFPQLLHAKLVVVDGTTGFLMGSPFVNGYWDDSCHEPADARRPVRELGGRPLHDLSVRLDGPSVSSLAAVFVELWNTADDVTPGDDERLPGVEREPDESVRIVCSAPRARRAHHAPGRAEILPALLAGIARAERLVYVEHQYMSSVAVIDALARALERRPRLEVIVVLNQNPDVTAYRGWQNRRLRESGLDAHPRVGLFALWSAGAAASTGRLAVNQVFVHSKVVAIDDRWAMVGSANLDGVSLQTYGDDFSGWLGRRVFRGVRNFDVAAEIGAMGSGTVPAVTELRTALWREHMDAPDLDGEAMPAGGWLAWWRARAQANAAALRDWRPGSDAAGGMVVLPYSRSSTPVRQLRDAGVPLAHEHLDICFDPSWVEVHLSPNWVRNMFA